MLNLTNLLDNLENTIVKSELGDEILRIGTHSGSFHADEALAISLLKVLPEYENAVIIRSRNPEVLSECDILVDVGAEFNVSEKKFDHHQRSFSETFNDKHDKIKLSSAGLIYKYYGKDVLRVLCNISTSSTNESKTESEGKGDDESEFIDIFYLKLYKNFMEHIDAIDNGIEVSENELKYNISTHLSSRVGFLNPNWNEEQSDNIINNQFIKAMKLTFNEYYDNLSNLFYSWWPAREIIVHSFNNRFTIDESGEILLLEQFCPWKSHLFDLEAEYGLQGKIKFVLYQDNRNKWRIQAVGISTSSFTLRLGLPEQWRGVRNEELSELSQIPGCIFVHANGFIGGNETKEGVIKMAKKTLQLNKK